MNGWRIRATLGCIVLGVAFVLVSGGAAEKEPPKPPIKDFGKEKAHKVIRAVDGDTVVLEMDGKEVKVRLIGVDTPETVHPTKQVEFYGKEASRFTANLLKGESVYVEYGKEKTDKYGRTLAYLYRAPDGLFINLEIVRQGYGHAYTKYPFEHMELFRHYEKVARESKKGLWADSEAIPGKDTTPEKAEGNKDKPAEKPKGETVYITSSGTKYRKRVADSVLTEPC